MHAPYLPDKVRTAHVTVVLFAWKVVSESILPYTIVVARVFLLAYASQTQTLLWSTSSIPNAFASLALGG